jgi:hypothetical protein
MPAKIARLDARPPFGLPEVLVAVHTSHLSCWKAGKAPICTPARGSSGESRLRAATARPIASAFARNGSKLNPFQSIGLSQYDAGHRA